jgi:hypothetical protein
MASSAAPWASGHDKNRDDAIHRGLHQRGRGGEGEHRLAVNGATGGCAGKRAFP